MAKEKTKYTFVNTMKAIPNVYAIRANETWQSHLKADTVKEQTIRGIKVICMESLQLDEMKKLK